MITSKPIKDCIIFSCKCSKVQTIYGQILLSHIIPDGTRVN